MPVPALMDVVINTFQVIGRQEQNAILIDSAAQRLRGLGFAVLKNLAIEYSKWGCPTRGHINLAVVSDGVTVAVEVDRSRPRKNSLLKLRGLDVHGKVVILTSPGAIVEASDLEGGIVVVALNDDLRTKLPPIATPRPAGSEPRPLSTSLRLAIGLYVGCRDIEKAAHFAGVQPAEFRRLLHREDVRAEFSRKVKIMEQANAELRARIPTGENASSFAATERRQRIERRTDLRRSGRTPVRPTYIYRVEPEIIAVPDWALEHAARDLLSTNEYVWLSTASLARKICRMDAAEGGHPDMMRVRAQRCQVCGLLRLGVLARSRAELDESAVDGRKLPCSQECLARAQLHARQS